MVCGRGACSAAGVLSTSDAYVLEERSRSRIASMRSALAA